MKPTRAEFVKRYMELTKCSEQYADGIWFTLGSARDSRISGASLAVRTVRGSRV